MQNADTDGETGREGSSRSYFCYFRNVRCEASTPQRSVDLELGFTRSFVYNLNSISFNIGFNLGQLYRKSQK